MLFHRSAQLGRSRRPVARRMLAGEAINLVAELADVRAEVMLDGVDSLVGLTKGVVGEELERAVVAVRWYSAKKRFSNSPAPRASCSP